MEDDLTKRRFSKEDANKLAIEVVDIVIDLVKKEVLTSRPFTREKINETVIGRRVLDQVIAQLEERFYEEFSRG